MPQVVEAYRDFVPTSDVRATVEELLRSVPPEYLGGLRTVVLTNSAALGRERTRRWTRSRGRKVRHAHAAGLYHPKWKGEEAWIELFVDHIVSDVPTWVLRLPIGRTLFFSTVVFHEVGHHIHARFQPEHREKEDVADGWAKTLGRRHLRRRHPIARVVLRPVAWLLRRVPRRGRG